MRNMLALFAAVLLTVAGLGWYLDWYKVRSQPAAGPGQRSVSIDFDTRKIGNDLHKSEQRLQEIIESKKGHAADKNAAKQAEPASRSAGEGKGILSGLKVHLDKGPSVHIGPGDGGH